MKRLYFPVPVELDQSVSLPNTSLANYKYGCTMDNKFYPEGAQVNACYLIKLCMLETAAVEDLVYFMDFVSLVIPRKIYPISAYTQLVPN